MSYIGREPWATSFYLVCNKDSYGIRIPKQEGLLILVGLVWAVYRSSNKSDS